MPAPSSQAIQAAYRNEPQRWAHPTKRDARLVVGSSQANAQAALAALRSGTSFSTVSKRYSADQTLSQNGGVAKGLIPGTTTAALERALFAAPAGRLEGPLHVGNGWVVFKVQRITKLADQTLAKATARIKQDLSSTAQSQAVDKSYGTHTTTYINSKWSSNLTALFELPWALNFGAVSLTYVDVTRQNSLPARFNHSHLA